MNAVQHYVDKKFWVSTYRSSKKHLVRRSWIINNFAGDLGERFEAAAEELQHPNKDRRPETLCGRSLFAISGVVTEDKAQCGVCWKAVQIRLPHMKMNFFMEDIPDI